MSHKEYYVNSREERLPGTPGTDLRTLPPAVSPSPKLALPLTAVMTVALLALTASVAFAAHGIPGPDDDVLLEALTATVRGDSLTAEQSEAARALLTLEHDALMERARGHIAAGQPGRAEIELTLVVAGADTSPGRTYERLSLLAYAQLIRGRRAQAAASLVYASDVYAGLDQPVHPVMPDAAGMALADAYVEIARGAPEEDREPLGRQAALWWAREGAWDHLEELSGLGPEERLIAGWAYAQVGRIDRATVHIAVARRIYRARIAQGVDPADSHEALARSYDPVVTGVAGAANPDSARVHMKAADLLR